MQAVLKNIPGDAGYLRASRWCEILDYIMFLKKLSYRWKTARRVQRSVKVTKHGTIRYVRYGFILVCYRNFFCDIRLQKCRDLENRVKGQWSLLKMSPFDREPMTSYWCSIVTMALSRAVSETFNVEKYRDLEIPVKSHSRSLKVVSFDRLGIVSY